MGQLITDKNTLINLLPEIIREQFNIKISDIKYIGGILFFLLSHHQKFNYYLGRDVDFICFLW